MKSLVKKFKKSLKKAIQDDFNSKGFSLISALVASVIGLIVIFGLNKSLIHLNTQSMQLQSQMKTQALISRVNNILNDDCDFNKLQAAIPFGKSPYFETEKSYGLNYDKGLNYFDPTRPNCFRQDTLCNIKMYYQVGNELKYNSFSCTTPPPPPPPES